MKFLILVFFVALIFFLRYWMKNHRSNAPKLGSGNWFNLKLNPAYEQILMQYSLYYRLLSDALKKKFGDRVMRFINEKEFIGKSNVEVTDLMRVLIAESAVKLTFGHRTYLLEKFEKIIIFKGEFYSEFSKSNVKGETNPRGVVVFSWNDFLEGDLKERDNLNVGLHEFAHALMNQTLGSGRFEDNYFLSWVDLFFEFYNKKENIDFIRTNELFRQYAFRNEMEMFAVATEHFFETPVQFKKEIPELYQIMSKVLNQDTAICFPEDHRIETKEVIEGMARIQSDNANDAPHEI